MNAGSILARHPPIQMFMYLKKQLYNMGRRRLYLLMLTMSFLSLSGAVVHAAGWVEGSDAPYAGGYGGVEVFEGAKEHE